jgi:hypothetical protein
MPVLYEPLSLWHLRRRPAQGVYLLDVDGQELPASEKISGPLHLRPDRYASPVEVQRVPFEKLSSKSRTYHRTQGVKLARTIADKRSTLWVWPAAH